MLHIKLFNSVAVKFCIVKKLSELWKLDLELFNTWICFMLSCWNMYLYQRLVGKKMRINVLCNHTKTQSVSESDRAIYFWWDWDDKQSLRIVSKKKIWGHSKSTFVEVGRGVIEKRTKTNRGSGKSFACVYVRFSKKNAKIFEMKFYNYSKWSFIVIHQFSLLIIMAVWNIKAS